MSISRTRIFLINLVALVIGKGGVVIAGLAMVPLIISAGGVESYGMWAACGQLLAYTAALDLGIGAGLQNLVSHAVNDSQRRRVATAAGWALILLGGIGLCLVGAVFLAQSLNPGLIDGLFGSDAPAEQGRSMMVLAVIVIALTLPAQIPIRLMAGVQRQGRASLVQGGVALLALVGIPLTLAMGLPLTLGLALAIIPPILVPTVWAWWQLGAPQLRWARPTLLGDRSGLLPAIRSGLTLFVSQVAALAVFQTDVVLVSITNGPVEAARFATCARLLSIPLLAQGIILAAMWPAVAQAHAQGDHQWVRRSYQRMLAVSVGIIMPVSVVLALTSQWVIALWSGTHEAVPEMGLVVAYLVFSLSALWTNLHAQYLNACGSLSIPAAVALVQAVLNLIAVIVAVRHWGSEGVAWASAGCAVITSVIVLPLVWNHKMSRLST